MRDPTRHSASLVVAFATVLAVLACSSSTPDSTGNGSTSSSSGNPDTDGAASSSGGSSGTPDPGKTWVKTTTETFEHAGATRKYILSVPLDYDAGKKYPL